MKKVLVIACVLLALGVALFAGGFVLSGGDVSAMDMETELVHIDLSSAGSLGKTETTYPASGVERVIIDAVSADVRAGYADDDLIHVIASSGEDVEFAPPANGTLTVAQKRNGGKLFSLDFFRRADAITVLLPHSFAPDLTVATESGDVEIGVTKLGRTDIGTISGDIDIISLSCGPFSAETVSGDVDLGTVNAETFNLSTTSGDADFDRLDAPGGVRLSSVSGDIDGVLTGAREDYAVSVSTVSGKTNLMDGGTGAVTLSASTVSGDMDIEFEERY